MARHSMINGVKVMFTPEEEAFRDAEELEWSNSKPLEDWKENMQRADNDMMPRYLEDHIKDDHDGVASNEFLQTKYDDKKALRATKP